MNCQDSNKMTKLSDFLHSNEIWLMFRPIPMYGTNAIQLHFLMRLFWYLSHWSGLICSIFCTCLYIKDTHCAHYFHPRGPNNMFVESGSSIFYKNFKILWRPSKMYSFTKQMCDLEFVYRDHGLLSIQFFSLMDAP